MKYSPLVMLALGVCMVSLPAWAQNELETSPKASVEKASRPVAVELSDADEALIHRIEDYLSNITTAAADFMQVAPDGNIVNGKFYLQRPNQMRWQYEPPTPILMVTRGDYLTYYDYELEQVSDVPLDSTLVGFLARDQVKFDDTVMITRLEEQPGVVRISLVQNKRPEDGELTLEFSDQPLQIRNMVIKDTTGQTTTVSLSHARFGLPLDAELFKFKDPRSAAPKPGGRR